MTPRIALTVLFTGVIAASASAALPAFETPGLVWSDESTSTSPENGLAFHGEFSNQAVTATVEHLPAHDFLQISVQLLIIRSWDGCNRSNGGPRLGPDYIRVGLDDGDTGGRTLVHACFSNTPVMSGFSPAANFQTFPSPVPGDKVPYMTGADLRNTFGFIYPAAGNQPPIAVHQDALYTLKMTLPHTAERAVLSFRGMGLQSISDESWGVTNLNLRPLTKAQYHPSIGEKDAYDTFIDDQGNEFKQLSVPSFSRLLQTTTAHDATAANDAFWKLAGGSDATADYLARTIKPVKLDVDKIKKLAAAIYEGDQPKDESDPRVQALTKLGITAEPVLRDLRQEKSESPSRLDWALMDLGITPVDDPDMRQWIVAMRLLDAIGTPAAKKARATLMGQ
jgi:hypothetical protein